MGLIKSEKFKGVYYYPTEDGDEVYYFTYKRLTDQKKFTVKVGTKSGGHSLTTCHHEREKAINEMRIGHVPTLVRNKRRIAEITSFDMIAEEYYQYKKLIYDRCQLERCCFYLYKSYKTAFGE